MKKKVILLSLITIALAILLTSCSGVEFDELKIVAESVVDIPSGEYTLDYTIDDLEKYSENYDLEISVKVFDDDNTMIDVANNRTFAAETDNIYYVTVYVKTKIDGVYKTVSKSYTVTTIKTAPTLVLKLIILDDIYDYRTISLNYGDSYDIANMPEIPDTNPVSTGYTYTISDRYWVVLDRLGKETILTQEHLNKITKTITIFAHYDFTITVKECTISFDTIGGTALSPITQPYNSSIERPADPIKTDSYFCGWYEDINYTQMFNWTNATVMSASRTLYAKWLEDNCSNQKDYFDYIYVEDTTTGYGFYKVDVKDYPVTILPAEVRIPNGHENKPVKIIDQEAFKNHIELESLEIPSSITTIRDSAFSGCTNLTNVIYHNGVSIDRLNTKVFENCVSLTSIIVPDTVTSIIDGAFDGCENLTTLTFTMDSKLITLTSHSFEQTAITELQLPAAIKDKVVTMKNKNGVNIIVTYFENPVS